MAGDQTSCKFIVGFNKSVLLCIYRSCRLEPSELQWWLLLLLLPLELCRFLEPLWSTLQDIQEEVTTSWPCYEENLHGHLSPCSITQSPKPLHLVHLNVHLWRLLKVIPIKSPCRIYLWRAWMGLFHLSMLLQLSQVANLWTVFFSQHRRDSSITAHQVTSPLHSGQADRLLELEKVSWMHTIEAPSVVM